MSNDPFWNQVRKRLTSLNQVGGNYKLMPGLGDKGAQAKPGYRVLGQFGQQDWGTINYVFLVELVFELPAKAWYFSKLLPLPHEDMLGKLIKADSGNR